MKNLQSVPYRERFSKVGYLLKHTFTVVGRDFDILNPIIRTIIYGAVHATIATLGFAFLIYAVAADAAALWPWGWGLLLIAAALYVYKFFYNNYQEVRQSYLVYQTVTGEDHSYEQAVADSREIRSTIRGVALLDMLMAYVRSARGQQNDRGLIAGIVSAVLAGLQEVWDLANHYLIPAAVIDRVTIKEGAQSMKRLKDQVPETLVGVFGIDIFGRVVGVLMAPVYTVMFLLAAWLSFAMVDWLPAVSMSVGDADLPAWMVQEGRLTLTLIPLILLIYLAKLCSVVLARVVTAVKIMYFTIFYMQITHPDRIAPELREELTRYLRMEEEPEDAADVADVATAEPQTE